jgi:glycosyltransferase involved in cell wall biosynthesis
VLEGLGGALLRGGSDQVELLVPSEELQGMASLHGLPGVRAVQRSGAGRRLWWEQLELPRLVGGRGDTLLGLTNTLPLGTGGVYRRALLIQNVAPLVGWARRVYHGRARARLEVLRALTLASVRRADVTFLFTEYGRDLVARAVPGKRIVAVHPGLLPVSQVDDGRIERPPYVVVAADLYRYKGVEDVIRAISAPALRHVHLHVCGAPMDRDYVGSLHRLVANLGVDTRVHFDGAVPRDEMVNRIRGALCLIQSSRLESLGLPLLEAMLCEVPVISTDIPAARELSRGQVRFYPAGDHEQLAKQLATIIEAGPDIGSLEMARAHAERMGWDLTAREMLEILDTLP